MKQEIKTTKPDSKEGLHTQGEEMKPFHIWKEERMKGYNPHSIGLSDSTLMDEYSLQYCRPLYKKAVNERKALLDSHRELLENLERILDRIGENGYQHDFPSAYERAIIALNNAKNI